MSVLFVLVLCLCLIYGLEQCNVASCKAREKEFLGRVFERQSRGWSPQRWAEEIAFQKQALVPEDWREESKKERDNLFLMRGPCFDEPTARCAADALMRVFIAEDAAGRKLGDVSVLEDLKRNSSVVQQTRIWQQMQRWSSLRYASYFAEAQGECLGDENCTAAFAFIFSSSICGRQQRQSASY